MFVLRQSTASQEVPLGPFVDSADGVTPETALTLDAADIKVWKSGASALVDKNSGGAVHMALGHYVATLDATDTNTVGPLRIVVHKAGAAPVIFQATVLPPQVYDSLIAGNDKLDVAVVEMAANTVTASAVASDAVSEIQSGLATAAALSAVAGYIDTEIQSILEAVDTEVAAIKAKTDQMAFTVANRLDVNVRSVNSVAIQGNGTGANPMRPA